MKRMKRNNGFGTIEAVILIAILIGLAILFREYIIKFVDMIFDAIFSDAGEIISFPKADITGYIGRC
jgi:hypothetical protein